MADGRHLTLRNLPINDGGDEKYSEMHAISLDIPKSVGLNSNGALNLSAGSFCARAPCE